MRRDVRYVLPALAVALVFMFPPACREMGVFIESRYFPILARQVVGDIERTADKLCWRRDGLKLRSKIAAEWHGVVTDGVTSNPTSIFDAVSGQPLAPVYNTAGQSFTRHVCIEVPPWATPSTRLVVRSWAVYPGWYDLWTVTVPNPDVVSEGAP